MRSKYKHWSNPGEHFGAVFLTTTCLDFVPCFEADGAKNLVAASLLDDCRHYSARLFGFVVMSNHVHLLLALPEGRSAPWLMARLKSNAARRVLPFISDQALESLAPQRGLNARSIWQVSYRGLSLGAGYLVLAEAALYPLEPGSSRALQDAGRVSVVERADVGGRNAGRGSSVSNHGLSDPGLCRAVAARLGQGAKARDFCPQTDERKNPQPDAGAWAG